MADQSDELVTVGTYTTRDQAERAEDAVSQLDGGGTVHRIADRVWQLRVREELAEAALDELRRKEQYIIASH